MWAKQKEKGQAIYLIIFGIIALIGSASLAIDGGRIYLDRRQVQNTADSAALAAALAGCSGEDYIQEAWDIASLNGYLYTDPEVLVEVNNPPDSGIHTGDSDYYEVIIETDTEVGLAQMVHSGPFVVEARAVALCEMGSSGGGPVGGGNAMIALKTSDTGGLKTTGNGDVTVTSGGIHVNSSHSSKAIWVTGNGDVNADVITVVGGYTESGNGEINPTPITGSPVMEDPLAALAPPTNPYSGSCTSYSLSGNNNDTISPGLYCSIQVSANADLYMEPGTYVIDGGNFKLSGNGNITASSSGVQLILLNGANMDITGNGDFIMTESFIYIESGYYKIAGNGDMIIDAPSSGQWAGMALFMDQNNTSTVTIVGNGDSGLEGTMYAASSPFHVAGNGDDFVFNAQMIGYDFTVSGNGETAVNYVPGELFQDPFASSSMISLVE